MYVSYDKLTLQLDASCFIKIHELESQSAPPTTMQTKGIDQLMMVERLFLVVPRGCLQFVIVVFPDHTHLLFMTSTAISVQHEKKRLM